MLNRDEITKIKQAFDSYIQLYPLKTNEILHILNSLNDDIQPFFMKAIVQMPVTDIISVNINDIVKHVEGIYHAITAIDYCKHIPTQYIFDYVLPYRINDEAFSLYSPTFYNELLPLINTNSIQESALAINYWCYSKATYHQADDRTQNAIATINLGKGRCGEESVLLVSALRSIGIPSRQCYSPYWTHCDDNHAWVEVFTGDKWEFLGACEPEEKLNIGWFNNAASKAAIIRHRIFEYNKREINADQNFIYKTEPSTDMYVETRKVTVTVISNGQNISNARVGLYTINYCMPKLLLEKNTNDIGIVEFEIGKGDIIFFAYADNKYNAKVCKQDESNIIIDISKCISRLAFDLVPYQGNISDNEYKASAQHFERLSGLLHNREAIHSTYNNSKIKYMNLAQLNFYEIKYFLEDNTISQQDKDLALHTLSDKDFSDVKKQVLYDMLTSLKYRDNFSASIFKSYLLPLRVENEPLYPQREFIADYCDNFNLKTPIDIYKHLQAFKLMDAYSYTTMTADIKGVLTNKLITSYSLPIHFVQICRAIGIAARLNPVNRVCEYFNGSEFTAIQKCNKEMSILLKLDNINEYSLVYGESYTISKLDNGYIFFLELGEVLSKANSIQLEGGTYLLTQCTRQIDGSTVGSISFFNDKINNITLEKSKYLINEKLKNIAVPNEIVTTNDKLILAFIENNSEPTEHFLNELIENEDNLRKAQIKILLYEAEESKNNLVSLLVKKQLAVYTKADFNNEWNILRKAMCIGDLRLPFITAVENKTALYSFANYNVGTVDLLLKILII